MGLFNKKKPRLEVPRHTAAAQAMKNAIARYANEKADVYTENVDGHCFEIPRSRVEKCLGMDEKELAKALASWSNL